jgi:RNA polymerase sigma-70 factor (ECF subfamily)
LDSDAEVEDYETFFRSVEPMLRRVAFLYTGDTELAHDLAQETLVRAWQHWSRVSVHPHPDAWCRIVLRNLATSRWRRAALERSRTPAEPGMAAAPSAEHLDIVAALGKLPASQRQALILHDVVGFSAEEIADELRVPAGTVRSWLSRGRHAMAESLADRLPDSRKGDRP